MKSNLQRHFPQSQKPAMRKKLEMTNSWTTKTRTYYEASSTLNSMMTSSTARMRRIQLQAKVVKLEGLFQKISAALALGMMRKCLSSRDPPLIL